MTTTKNVQNKDKKVKDYLLLTNEGEKLKKKTEKDRTVKIHS